MQCKWALVYSGTQPAVPPTQEIWRPAGGVTTPDPCEYRQLMTQPPPDSALWAGHDPVHGRLWQAFCPHAIGEQSGTVFLTGSDPYFVPDGSTPDETAPADPISLLNEVRDRVAPPTPALHFGPDADMVAVKVPVWLWTDPQPPIVQTGAAGPFTAAVTATLVETTWEMGEPVDPAQPSGQAAPVTCSGTGVAFTAGADPGSPPCGYTYVWRSLPERTGGSGAWTVTVSATWEVVAVVTGGAAGTITETDTVTVQDSAPVEVREWRNVLVSGG